MAIKPVFSKSTGGKTSQQYLDELDALLKKNTGRFTNVGTETSSQSPMFAGNVGQATKMADPTGVGASTPMQSSQIEEPVMEEQPQGNSTDIIDFLNNFQNSIAISQATPQAIASSSDGGTVYSNGYIKYEDNTYRTGDANAYPIASLPDGGLRYSDGSERKVVKPIASLPGGFVRLEDGTIQSDKGTFFTENEYQGVQAISQGLFGGQQTVTQEYGNINPIEVTPGDVNLGTDFRTRDLKSKDIYFPVGAEVVQILRDDGTRYGTISKHQGYGNSVMLRLPSGEMLRLSHLSRIGELSEGQMIQPNTLVGTTGATGNVSGEHLDVEYYNQEGKIDNPQNFSGFTAPETYVTTTPPQSNKPAPMSTPQAPSIPQSQPTAPVQQPSQPVNSPIANAINKVNPTGQIDFGITETFQNNPEAARDVQAKTIENLGTAIGAPELNTQELSSSQGTNPIRQLAGNLVDAGARKLGINTDFGFSEALAGGRTTNTDRSLVPEVMASEGQIASVPPQAKDYSQVLGQNINDAKNYAQDEIKLFTDRASAKAGEGIQALKGIGAGIQGGIDNIFDRKKPQDVSGQRMIGEDTPSSDALPIESTMPGGVSNDIRDPFFKQGGSEMYKDFMNPGQEGDGALSLGLFNDRFYQDPNNIANVFGSTNLAGQATDKYKNYQRSLYQGKDEYGNDLYDQNEVNNFINSINPFTTANPTFAPEVRKISSAFASPTAGLSSAPKMASVNISAPRPTIQQRAPQMSSPVKQGASGPMSTPQISSQPSRSVSGPMSVYSAPKSTYSAPKSSPAPMSVYKAPQSTPAPKASGPMSVYSAPKSTPAPQSKPSTNIFSRAVSAVKSIFKR